jgi:hypothetical protein
MAKAACALVLLFAAAASAGNLTESDKIEALIQRVEKLEGAVFVRNGVEYGARDAGKHLREKWQWRRDQIRTARDFIVLAGSISTQTGKPYLIRWKDGRELKASDFLIAELKKLETP